MELALSQFTLRREQLLQARGGRRRPLDEAAEEEGCMLYYSGTHKTATLYPPRAL